jgi:hypothetical protein
MTLVLSVTSPETLWFVADRRLSAPGCAPKDDARKMLILEADDGVALLGYAGLGATALGTEPADWMSNVLRGRKLSIEQSLDVLADAANRHLPPHLVRLRGPSAPAHTILASTFVGGEPRVYTIDLALSPDRKNYSFRYTRHAVIKPKRPPRTPALAIGGSGRICLIKDKRWVRRILRIVRAYDSGKVGAQTVADALAALNLEVSKATADGSVGPRCVVAWRHRRNGVHKTGGGHQFYTGASPDKSSPALPIIAGGMDITALVGVIGPHMFQMLENVQKGLPDTLDKDALNEELAKLPDKPDEKLR